MSTGEEFSFRAVNEKRSGTPAPPAPAAPSAPAPVTPPAAAEPPAASPLANLPFDPWRLVVALGKNLRWIAALGFVCAALGFGLGLLRFKNLYTASASLIRQEVPNTFQTGEVGEAFKPKQLTVGTLVSVIRSPGIMKKVSELATPRISPAMLALKLTVTPERNTDVVRLEYEGWISPESTAQVLNLYAEAVVQTTRDLQAQEATQVNRVLKQQLTTLDNELAESAKSLLAFSKDAQLISADKETDAYLRQLGDLSLKYETARIEYETLDLKLSSLEQELGRHNPLAAKLQQAKDELSAMLVRYTEANPAVAQQRQRIEEIEKEVAAAAGKPVDESQLATSTAGTSLYLQIVELRAQKDSLKKQIEQFGKVRDGVQAKLTALPEKSVELARLRARQQSLETARNLLASRQREAQLFEEAAPGYYRLLTPVATQDVGARSRWPKVFIITFTLGLLGFVGSAGLVMAREAVDTRIKTAHDFARATGLPVILRIPTMEGDEGRAWAFRSWKTLFAQLEKTPAGGVHLGALAAEIGQGSSTLLYLLAGAAAERGHPVIVVADRAPGAAELRTAPQTADLATTLRNPNQIRLNDGEVLSVQTPGTWGWTRETRHQWQSALASWRTIRSLVVLIELPTSTDSESLLLAETLPNLLWVGGATIGNDALRTHVEVLRTTNARLVGSVFNQRGSASSPAWLAKWGIGLLLASALPLSAAGPTPPPAPPKLAPWQERYTLGPGDTVNLALFGFPNYNRTEVPIGPDGKLSYLEAHEIDASGRTIDELRTSLDLELGKYYRDARTIVTPGIVQSKKYFILGKVVDKGVFTLDRPMTIIEAVSKARGLETGLFQQNTVELADLPRSFLIRRGQRMPVDFERLFQQGDLSQNIQIEPDDYLYFPSANVNEVYVLGAVGSPGIQGFTPNATVISMVTTRGGFTPKAYTDHVLVVRGSLSQPKTFVVNASRILKAKEHDFPLEPKDIVFVSERPWVRPGELLDIAIRTFVQAASSGWATGNINPLITSPILPIIR